MPTPLYHERLTRIRDTFPSPVSNRMHDAYFVFSILRALDGVDAMKSEVPLLGHPRALDYVAAEQAALADEGRSVEEVARLLVGTLEGLPIWGHPRTQINVIPPPSIPSIIGALLPAIYNPNLVSDDTSCGLMLTEAAVTAMASRLVGYDAAQAGGVFTFGGTGTVLYGAKLGIEKAFPDAMDHGVPAAGVILASAPAGAWDFLTTNGRSLLEKSLPVWETAERAMPLVTGVDPDGRGLETASWTLPLLGIGLVWLLWRRSTRRFGWVMAGFYAACLAASAGHVYPFGAAGRTDIFAFPAAICLFAVGIQAVTERLRGAKGVLRLGAAGIVVALALWRPVHVAYFTLEHDAQVVDFLSAQALPDDAIILSQGAPASWLPSTADGQSRSRRQTN